MTPQTRTRFARIALFAILAIWLGTVLAQRQKQEDSAAVSQKSERPAPMAGAQLGGPFSLIDQDGKPVTQENFAKDYKLIYFGFTYCPAICPTELQKVARAMNELEQEAPEAAAHLQPIFISVDPERDTPEVMKGYVQQFHPRLIGLTGSPEQVEAAKKAYRVFAKKVQDETMNDYTVDHSSFIYLMSPDDQLLAMYRVNDNAEDLAGDIKKHIEAAQN
ncbi:MAG: SCO family protein [Alphaproteobacteria bacterium]|nr:SCO family protein [Alphaproteobacteria bacterium]